jgi:hypothetical protein
VTLVEHVDSAVAVGAVRAGRPVQPPGGGEAAGRALGTTASGRGRRCGLAVTGLRPCRSRPRTSKRGCLGASRRRMPRLGMAGPA